MRVYQLMLAAFTLIVLSASVGAVTSPSGILSYVTIKLSNSQGSAYSQNSQIMLTVNSLASENYEASNLQNVEFFYANGTVIPSWLEGNLLNEGQSSNLYTSANTVYWLRIYPANTLLGADSSNYIYMGFASTSTNLFGSTAGEAPQLSSPYAEYDNGNSIFSFYTNFEGTSTPSGFITYSNTPSFNNSITFNTLDGGIYYDAAISSPLVIEDLYVSPTVSSGSYPEAALSFAIDHATSSFILGKGYAYIYADVPGAGKFASESWSDDGNTRSSIASVSQYPTANTVYGYYWNTTGSQIAYTNYNAVITTSNTLYVFASYNAALSNAAGGDSYTAQWFRGRVSPPGGVMAGTTYEPAPTISIANAITSNSIAVIRGSASDNALVTATCATGDTCQIYRIGQGSVASGTNTVTLAYNALPLGYSIIYANDITDGAASGNVYVRRVNTVNSIAITFVNTQSTAIPADAQLSITFAAHNFTVLESNTLNNTILFFKNGTVAYSWLEGGVTNNIEYTANILSVSANVFIWFKAPPTNTFLPANTGVATTNTIYIGFDIPQNNLMDGNFTGEAPQLSPIYAEYDNGAKIFNYYLVNPTTTAGWTMVGSSALAAAPSGSYFDTPNAFSEVSSSDSSYMYNSNPAFSPGNVITYWMHISNNNLGNLMFMDSSSGAGQMSRIDERTSSYPDDTGFLYSTGWTDWTGSGNLQDPVASNWDKIDIVISSSSSMIMYDTPTSNTPLATLGSNNTGSFTPNVDGDYFGLQGDAGSGGTDYWDAIIVRDYLPGGVMPMSSPAIASEYAAPTVSTSPSSQSITPGQNAMITSTPSGGVQPYTYQWYAAFGSAPTPTASNATEANILLRTGTTNGEAQSSEALFATNSLTTLGTYYFTLYLTDSYPTTVDTLPASVTLSTSSSGGGGSAPKTYSFTLKDNINSTFSSNSPVITATVNGATHGYYQNQLPVTFTSNNYSINLSFTCSFAANGNTYTFDNIAYGIGVGVQCGKEYNTSGAETTAIYEFSSNSMQNTSTTTTVSTTSTASTTSASIPTTLLTTMQTTILPIQPESIVINVPGNQTSATICNATAETSYDVEYSSINSGFKITNTSRSCFTLNVVNLTSSVSTAAGLPSNLTKLIVVNVSINGANATINAEIGYPCDIQASSVAPYILENSSWIAINPYTVNASACVVHFSIPQDPIVAIFEAPATPAQNTTQPNKTSFPYLLLLLGIVAFAIIIAIFAVLLARKKKRNR